MRLLEFVWYHVTAFFFSEKERQGTFFLQYKSSRDDTTQSVYSASLLRRLINHNIYRSVMGPPKLSANKGLALSAPIYLMGDGGGMGGGEGDGHGGWAPLHL